MCVSIKTELHKFKKKNRCEQRHYSHQKCCKINQKRHLQLKDSFSWPPQPKDLEPEKLTLPNKLNLIMNSLLNDKDEQLSHKDRL